MKECSEEVILALRGFLCKSDYPSLQYVGQFGTDDQVLDMVTRVPYVGPVNF